MTDPIAKLLGDWSVSLSAPSILFRILLCVCISAVIGCERSSKRHSAGLRTFMLVSLTATVAMLLDIFLNESSEINFYLLSAAGMICVAVISVHSLLVSSRSQIKGLTTAAGLWASSVIGLTCGAGFYTVTLVSSALLLICLSVFPMLERYLKNRSNHFEIHLELKDSRHLQNFVSTLRRLGLIIDDIEANPAYKDSGLSVYTVALSIKSAELKKYKTHSEIIEALGSLDYINHIEEMLS